MANPYVNMTHVTTVTLHEGWLEHKSYYEYKWRKSWMVLQGNNLYFYNSQNTSEERALGLIKVESGFKFMKRDKGSEKAGYKFELHTSRSVTKFKARKFSERELWKAYLEGVAMGEVSDNLDLPPEILVQIRLLLQAQYINRDNSNESNSADSIVGDSTEFEPLPAIPPYDEDGLCYSNDDASADSGCVDDFYQEPANYHLLNYVFFNDSHKRELPSWFFQNCTRDTAEEILKRGVQFGNTLMRKGSANTSNLVISKKMEGRSDGYSHYVIDIHPDGYKLKVENPHQPMKCLTDIMNFFVETSGALTTKPMTCNNLQKLGISPDHIYNPVILPNPAPAAVEITEDSHGYTNTTPVTDISKAAWMKHRSQSIPNITPLKDLQLDVRRLSVSTEANKPQTLNNNNNSNNNNNQKARFMVPSTDDIPLPPPPPPPCNPPPKLPSGVDRSNRSRVSSSSATFSNPPPIQTPSTPQPPPPTAAPPTPQVPPPLPDNHPPTRKSILGSTLSIASKFDELANKKTPPPVASKPVKKIRDDSPNKKKIGDAPRDRQPMRRSKQENEIVYTKIMKKKTQLNQSKSVPLSYENWETSKSEEQTFDETKSGSRISSIDDTKLIYAQIDTWPYVLYQDLSQHKKTYDQFNLNGFDDVDLSTSFQHDINMEYPDNDNAKSSYETYEMTQSVFKDRSPACVGPSVDECVPKDKVFQEINFFPDETPKRNNLTTNKRNTKSCEIYEPVCDNYKSKNLDVGDTSHRPISTSNSIPYKKIEQKKQELENEYEIIHSVWKKPAPPVTKPRTIKGISSPGQIYYESVEWKNMVNRPRVPSPKPRRRTNSLTWRTEKFCGDTGASKKSNTLNALDDLKSGMFFSDDKYYDEVLVNGLPNEEQVKPISNYVDVIADYEDIKAARISQKQTATRKHSVPENEFKKKLEMMFGDSNMSKTLPAIKTTKRPLPGKPDLRTVVASSPPPLSQAASTDDVYDDLDAYQNTASTNFRNK